MAKMLRSGCSAFRLLSLTLIHVRHPPKATRCLPGALASAQQFDWNLWEHCVCLISHCNILCQYYATLLFMHSRIKTQQNWGYCLYILKCRWQKDQIYLSTFSDYPNEIQNILYSNIIHHMLCKIIKWAWVFINNQNNVLVFGKHCYKTMQGIQQATQKSHKIFNFCLQNLRFYINRSKISFQNT